MWLVNQSRQNNRVLVSNNTHCTSSTYCCSQVPIVWQVISEQWALMRNNTCCSQVPVAHKCPIVLRTDKPHGRTIGFLWAIIYGTCQQNRILAGNTGYFRATRYNINASRGIEIPSWNRNKTHTILSIVIKSMNINKLL